MIVSSHVSFSNSILVAVRPRMIVLNTLVFPNLSSANASYKLLREIAMDDIIGPIQMGLNKPVHILDVDTSTRDIVNMVALAVIDAIVEENIKDNKLSRIV